MQKCRCLPFNYHNYASISTALSIPDQTSELKICRFHKVYFLTEELSAAVNSLCHQCNMAFLFLSINFPHTHSNIYNFEVPEVHRVDFPPPTAPISFFFLLKGVNFCDFLFAVLHMHPLMKKGLLYQERICSSVAIFFGGGQSLIGKAELFLT